MSMRPAVAAIAILCTLVAATSAQERVRVFGDRVRNPTAPEEFVRTYVDLPKDHDGDTVPLAVGMQLTPGFVRAIQDLPSSGPGGYSLTFPLPDGTMQMFNTTTVDVYNISFPAVGRNPFIFSTVSYDFTGHVPAGLYDIGHFEVRFFMEGPEWWWSEQFLGDGPNGTVGPCGGGTAEQMYKASLPVPVDCWPGNPSTSVDVGHYIRGQGIHIYNIMEPAWQAYATGASATTVDSLTWGMLDGRIAYVESMFARDLALQPDVKRCIDFSSEVPKHFDTERWMPTRRCLVAGPSNIKLEYDKFVKVPGGCAELRANPETEVTGWFPEAVMFMYGDADVCKVAVPPPT